MLVNINNNMGVITHHLHSTKEVVGINHTLLVISISISHQQLILLILHTTTHLHRSVVVLLLLVEVVEGLLVVPLVEEVDINNRDMDLPLHSLIPH